MKISKGSTVALSVILSVMLGVLVAAANSGCGSGEAPAPTGQIIFLRHCASCHGASGTGDGPMAASLRTPPADLTTIAQRDGGFDEGRVMRIIDGRRQVAEHGSREMPVWGGVFGDELAGQRNSAYTTLLHARALTDYLRSIQRSDAR